MIKIYELSDREGRYIKASYDDKKRLVKVTMFMYPKDGVSIEEVFEICGFNIETEMVMESPILVPLKKKG
jgi:hypothetical protein